MADDMVVLQCEKCGARLKVRAAAIKFVKDVKCVKCGNKVSTRSLAPAAAASGKRWDQSERSLGLRSLPTRSRRLAVS